jgi:hypothetical protein
MVATTSHGLIERLGHFEVLLTAIVLPFGATMILGAIEGLVEPLRAAERLVKIGWDMCILSAGASGIFSTPDLVRSYSYMSVTLALMSLLSSIGSGVIIMHIRKAGKKDLTAWQALLAAVLGAGALGLPTYYSLHLGR